MGDTNFFSGLVKILENPIQIFLNNKTVITKFRVEIPQRSKNKIMTLIFWGNLASEVQDFYNINDYIFVEGYLSMQNKKSQTLIFKNLKQPIITVLKVYPFLLESNRIISKV